MMIEAGINIIAELNRVYFLITNDRFEDAESLQIEISKDLKELPRRGESLNKGYVKEIDTLLTKIKDESLLRMELIEKNKKRERKQRKLLKNFL